MKKERILLAINVALIMGIAGCSNAGNGLPTDPTLNNDGFKGITRTEDDPTPLGPLDRDDWKSDGYWDWKYPTESCRGGSVTFSKHGTIASDSEVAHIPRSFAAHPAYPNPCNGGTVIRLDLPQTSHVYCAIINDKYQKVGSLICQQLGAGSYSVWWNGKDASGNPLPTDVYRCIMLATDHQGNFLFASHGDIWVKY